LLDWSPHKKRSVLLEVFDASIFGAFEDNGSGASAFINALVSALARCQPFDGIAVETVCRFDRLTSLPEPDAQQDKRRDLGSRGPLPSLRGLLLSSSSSRKSEIVLSLRRLSGLRIVDPTVLGAKVDTLRCPPCADEAKDAVDNIGAAGVTFGEVGGDVGCEVSCEVGGAAGGVEGN